MFFIHCQSEKHCGRRIDAFAIGEPDGGGWKRDYSIPGRPRWLCPEHSEGAVEPPDPFKALEDDAPERDDFGFTEPEDGSAERYERRTKSIPWLQHRFWWAVHNLVAHVAIGLVPVRATFRFHDWTSHKMHQK